MLSLRSSVMLMEPEMISAWPLWSMAMTPVKLPWVISSSTPSSLAMR